MESQSEVVGGEQNGQTVQPLVANQNVESSAHEIKKRKNREAAKKRREEKKQRMEENVRQLEETRAENVELKKRVDKQKKKHAVSSGKLKQMQKYIELVIEDRKLLHQTIELQITTVKQQNTMFNILTQRLVPGTTGFDTGETGLPVHHPTINQPRAKMEPPGPVTVESSPQSDPPLNYDGLTPGGDPFGSHGLKHTSPPRAVMASGNSPMEALPAAGEQLPWGMTPVNTFATREAGPSIYHPPVYPSGTTKTPESAPIEYPPEWSQSHLPQGMPHLVSGTTGFDTGETGLRVHHPTINQLGAKMEPPGPVIAESSPQLHWNNVEQPPLNYDCLAPRGDRFESHGLNHTSPPRAAMASGNPLMEVLLVAGKQLPWGMTPVNTFGTREAGPSVRYPPVYLPPG